MISINCGLYLPASLKPLFQNISADGIFEVPRVSVQCEFGIIKNNKNNSFTQNLTKPEQQQYNVDISSSSSFLAGRKEEGEEGRYSNAYNGLRKLWDEGRKLLLDELQVNLKFVIEFPSSEEDGSVVDNQEIHEQSSQNSQNLLTEVSSDLNKDKDWDQLAPISEPIQNQLAMIVMAKEEEEVKEEEPVTTPKPELVNEVEEILSLNNPDSVQLCSEGIGGTYFIENEEGKRIAVFKPSDEEPGAVFNPKGPISDPLLPPGGGAIREVAAHLLDRGFAGVPETYLLSNVQHPAFPSQTPKTGSLQRYIENIESHEMSSSRFSVEDVHKIGILDVRLFNMDRNSENYLIQQNNNSKCPKLIPIDHSYILPPSLSFVWFEWLHWKQAKLPFSKEHLDYIESLNIVEDAALLQQLGFDRESIRTMIISTTFLKIAALKFGYNLFQIGSILSRKKLNEESELERMINKANNLLCGDLNEEQFIENITKVITEELQNKK